MTGLDFRHRHGHGQHPVVLQDRLAMAERHLTSLCYAASSVRRGVPLPVAFIKRVKRAPRARGGPAKHKIQGQGLGLRFCLYPGGEYAVWALPTAPAVLACIAGVVGMMRDGARLLPAWLRARGWIVAN